MRFACVVCCVAAAAASLAAGGRDGTQTYRRNFTPLEFVNHVMMNESSWTLVLRENLRNLPPSPYADRFGDALLPAAGGDGLVEGRAVVARALSEYAEIGSFARYAANTVHRCLLCFVVRHLSFQTHYVVRLFAKLANPGTVLMELRSLKDNIVVAIDKLCVVQSRLDLVLSLKWEVARLIQYDVALRMRFAKYPAMAHHRLETLENMLLRYLEDNCAPFSATREFFEDLGVPVDDPLILDSVLNVVVDRNVLMRLGRSHAEFLARYLRNLRFETMPRSTWAQIFYESDGTPAVGEPDETNTRISPRITPETVGQTPETAESDRQPAEPATTG